MKTRHCSVLVARVGRLWAGDCFLPHFFVTERKILKEMTFSACDLIILNSESICHQKKKKYYASYFEKHWWNFSLHFAQEFSPRENGFLPCFWQSETSLWVSWPWALCTNPRHPTNLPIGYYRTIPLSVPCHSNWMASSLRSGAVTLFFTYSPAHGVFYCIDAQEIKLDLMWNASGVTRKCLWGNQNFPSVTSRLGQIARHCARDLGDWVTAFAPRKVQVVAGKKTDGWGKGCIDITLLKARHAVRVLVMNNLRSTEGRTIMRTKTDEELK